MCRACALLWNPSDAIKQHNGHREGSAHLMGVGRLETHLDNNACPNTSWPSPLNWPWLAPDLGAVPEKTRPARATARRGNPEPPPQMADAPRCC